MNEIAEHAGRNTIQPKDFVIWQHLCANSKIPLPDLQKVIENAADAEDESEEEESDADVAEEKEEEKEDAAVAE